MRWIVIPAIALGMLVVVPLGLRLLSAPGLGLVRRFWLGPAAVGVVSLLLPTGVGAAALAAPYAATTLTLAGAAAARLAEALRAAAADRPVAALRAVSAAELAVLTALVTPSVAGVSLVAERGGWALLGFEPGVLLLTVAHFHYAGFAAALVASLVARLPDAGRPAAIGALTVPAGTLLVLAGFFLGEGVELAGAVVLTAGMWIVGALTWRARSSAPQRATRALLGVSSVVLVLTMLLALDWALGEAAGVPKLSLTWMAATHGVLNALGFGLCSVLAWSRFGGRTRPAAS